MLRRVRPRLASSLLKTSCRRRHFTVLGLESSADDTCAAVVTSDRRILSNVVSRQNALHVQYGGIEPLTAIKAHHDRMPDVVRQALHEASLTMDQIDGVAYTRGPGMIGCLRSCSVAARTLASVHGKPVVGVHHMQAHALTPLLTSPPSDLPAFPFLTLLISGGHTLLLLATSHTRFRILAGQDVDLSVGRAFDKTAKLLQIPWGEGGGRGPGAALEAFAATASLDLSGGEPVGELIPTRIPAPGRLLFSYAGTFSEVGRAIEARGGIDAVSISERARLAKAFQRAAVAQLEEKVVLGLEACERKGESVGHVVVSGGVASNGYLRERLQQAVQANFSEVKLVYPPPALCTDNAAMIAWASMHRFLVGDTDPYDLDTRNVWSVEDIEDVKAQA